MTKLFNRMWAIYAVVVLALMSVGSTFASGITLPTIDPQPIFDGVSSYLPWVFGILAIPAGIILAIQIAKFVINAFLGAFKGNGLGT